MIPFATIPSRPPFIYSSAQFSLSSRSRARVSLSCTLILLVYLLSSLSLCLSLSLSLRLSLWLVVLIPFLSFSIISSVLCFLYHVYLSIVFRSFIRASRDPCLGHPDFIWVRRYCTGSTSPRGRQSMLPPFLAQTAGGMSFRKRPLYTLHLIICIVEQNHRSFSSIHVSPWSPWVSRFLIPSGTEVPGVYTVLVYIGALSMYADGEIVYVYLYAYIRLSCFGF